MRGRIHTARGAERLAELLALRAVAGLSPREFKELEELLPRYPEVDARDEWVAAGFFEAPPPSLRERLLKSAAGESPRSLWPARIWCLFTAALGARGWSLAGRKPDAE